MTRVLIITLFLWVTFCRSQTVMGIVQSAQNGVFIKTPEVTFNEKAIAVDSNGIFKMKVQKGTMYYIRVKHAGFISIQQKRTFRGDTSIVFFMSPRVVGLNEVTVSAEKDNTFGISRLNNVEGTTMYAGKKSEAVYVQDLNANLAANNSRQVFSKIPGINVYENDGTGSNIGIGGRGLDPNRITNFNTRQNGYDISADALGYPESYYTPPTEAIDRIEILRGAAGLQFGTQFGGMINYKFAEPPVNKKISGNFRQTGGSFGFFNSFNQLQGTVGKVSYSTFYQYKHYDGWRARSMLNSHNAFGQVGYRVNEKLFIKAEYTYMTYLSQQPGGLTDKQFKDDPTLVTRHRNYFNVNWNLLAINADYKLTENTRINLVTFGLNAGRQALGYLGRPNRADDTSANRNLLSDTYSNRGAELRLLRRYDLLGNSSHFLIGARLYHGNTLRDQGDADKSDKPHFEFLHPDNLENSAYTFPSQNYALFCENNLQLTKKWSVSPGARLEYIQTASEGYYRVLNTNLAGDTLLDRKVTDNRSKTRSFALMGLGTQYRVNSGVELYANFSQNYRAINFNDMRVDNPNYQVDPAISDEKGFTADGGVRGALKDLLYYDVSVFLLQYDERIGTTLKVDTATSQIVRYRTNIGNSRNMGVEAMVELDWLKLIHSENKHKLSTFVNVSFIDARYLGGETSYKNKQVEYAAPVIFRTGITYGYKKWSMTCQYAYTGEQFSDATNAVSSPSGIFGIVPAYQVLDLSARYSYRWFGVSGGINNFTNTSYFTRRAEGYPGPGILPADPVNGYVTLSVKF